MKSDISSKRLTMYALDVARGLAYLAEQNVSSKLGILAWPDPLTRVITIAALQSEGRKETLSGSLDATGDTVSGHVHVCFPDIWSFGVVLFEVITFGSNPYHGKTNNQVLDYVKNGNTLQIPSGVKPPLEGLSKAC
ncbi:hypothetical protein ACLKA7_005246 [Drosophila subpalustris]